MVTLSIGIPTYERPDLLLRLIKSIVDQKGLDKYNIELVIGDDSKESIYNELFDIGNNLPANIKLQYNFHKPSKGQNKNVASLIDRATGKYFCLMHDDDFFLEEAIIKLLEVAIQNDNCIVFGKQLIYNNEYDFKDSELVNDFFKRTKSFIGKQKDSVEMAMLQQCPNDGFILKTEIAKLISYRPESIIGTACDFDFALRAALVYKINFYFIDDYTTVYAISDDSVTMSFHNNAGERKLKILYEFNTNLTHPEVFHSILKTDLSMVISHYIIVKNYSAAKKYLFSITNLINYLWYKPATYLQVFKLIFKV